MKKRKFTLPILAAVLILILVGCGVSQEKLSEAESLKQKMIEAKDRAEETYLDLVDSSQRKTLDELAGKEAELEEIDLSKQNDKRIDELLPQLQELTEQYAYVESEMNKTLNKENEEKKERLKHTDVDVFFINKTGKNLSSIILHDTTEDIKSDNFIGDKVTLNAGYTLMGASLDLYEDSTSWEFLVTDESGTEYTLSCGNLKEIGEDGASIVLKLDSEGGGGSAEIGAYVALKEPEIQTENAEEGASEGAADSASGEASASEGN